MKYSKLTHRKKRELEEDVAGKLSISTRGSRRLLEEDEVDFHGTNRQRITRNDYTQLDDQRKKHKNFYRNYSL